MQGRVGYGGLMEIATSPVARLHQHHREYERHHSPCARQGRIGSKIDHACCAIFNKERDIPELCQRDNACIAPDRRQASGIRRPRDRSSALDSICWAGPQESRRVSEGRLNVRPAVLAIVRHRSGVEGLHRLNASRQAQVTVGTLCPAPAEHHRPQPWQGVNECLSVGRGVPYLRCRRVAVLEAGADAVWHDVP